MNKVLSVAVLLALTTASDDFSDNSLNVFSKIKEDLKKAGHFVAEHPQIITTAAKILARDDEFADTELNFKDFVHKVEGGVQKTAGFIADHPELVSTVAKIIAKKDDEITDDEFNFLSKVKEDLKKAGHFVAEHPQIITTGAKIATKLIKDDADEELFKIPKPQIDVKVHFDETADSELIDMINLPNFKPHVHKPHVVVYDDEELFKIPKPKVDIGVHFDEAADAELNAKDVFKKIGNGLLTGVKIASKFLDDEAFVHPRIGTIVQPRFEADDEELFKIPKPKVDIGVHFDEAADAELNAKDVFKKIGNGLLTGVKIASKFLDDEVADEELRLLNPIHPMSFDDEELFKIPKPKVDIGVHFDEVADSELNAKDVFKKIGNGLLTGVKIASKFLDDEAADQELFKIPKPQIDVKVHFDDEELFAHQHQNQTQRHEAVKKAQKDVKHASELLRKLHNIHHQRNGTHHDSLSNLGQLLHEGRQLHHKNATQVHDHNLSIKDKLKKAVDWVGDHPQVISEAAKAAKILKGKK